LRTVGVSGTLRPRMNRRLIVGLLVTAVLIAALAVWRFMPDGPAPKPIPAPVREVFHPAKPLQIEVQTVTAADGPATDAPAWIARELHHMVGRGKMKLAPLEGDLPIDAARATPAAFTLRVTLQDEGARAELALIAPDRVVDRRQYIELAKASQLATMQSLARQLPIFLSAPGGTADWSATLGTTDAAAYEALLRSSDALFGPSSTGFTSPPAPDSSAVLNVEHLEALVRRHRGFTRARALLALGYLSVGGEDQASLTKLAETAAERALTADAELTDAQAALGIVRLRRGEWTAAQEHFEAALALDASSFAALEGLGCLLMDVGHVAAALRIAARATALQPGNRGALQCATYARIATQTPRPNSENEPAATARIDAAMLLLRGDRSGAESVLRASNASSDELIRSVIDASGSKDKIPEALQIVTRSADDESIDAEAELLYGIALRRPDFVFNRMLRLAKQDEAVPLRLLWLPQTDFLRKHRRFRDVVSAAALTPYWQDHGLPDICKAEPKTHGCALKSK
jgi:hypothetical protein